MPGEGLLDLATRFDNLAIPLLNAHLTTERDLALVLRKHIPVFLRKKTRDAYGERTPPPCKK